MKATNHYYAKAWKMFWIGNLAIFLIPSILFLVNLGVDNIKVKFWYLFFCQFEHIFVFAIYGSAQL